MAKDFDVIAHGCNCFNTMGAGIAVQMAKHFGADKFKLEDRLYEGDINKLGQIDYDYNDRVDTWIVNCYTQHMGGKNLDYAALVLCLKKINHRFKGRSIGLPQIGCGIAGGDWNVVRFLIKKNLKNCDVTVVIYNK